VVEELRNEDLKRVECVMSLSIVISKNHLYTKIHFMNDLNKRLFNFGINVITYLRTLPETREYWALKNQLFRSCTSPGACYSESQGGCTMADFHNKINISLKEMRESNYWLRMISALRRPDRDLQGLIRESEELIKILGSISYKTRKKL